VAMAAVRSVWSKRKLLRLQGDWEPQVRRGAWPLQDMRRIWRLPSLPGHGSFWRYPSGILSNRESEKEKGKMKDTPYEVILTDRGPRFAVLLGALADRAKRIPLAVIGKFQKGRQQFSITLQTLSELVSNFRRRTCETVIDYEHASEFPELAQGGPIPAAGWLTAVEDAPDADGILWGHAEFTPRAAGMISSGEYKYISPVLDYGARDKTTGQAQGVTLVSCALTNRPFLEGLPAIAMSTNAREQQASAAQMMFLANIETEIAAKRTANNNLDYARAWSLVSSENPGLISAYNAAARRVSALRDAGINYAYSR
jgi:hypothetical protein